MHRIEVIKALLSLWIFRTCSPVPESRNFMCLNTYDAVVKLNEKFPEYTVEFLFKTISEEITIKNGRLTTFVWGYSKCARKIYNKK